MQVDVAQLVSEDELQAIPVAVVKVDEQLVGQHDVVVTGGLGGESIQRAIAVGEENVRSAR